MQKTRSRDGGSLGSDPERGGPSTAPHPEPGGQDPGHRGVGLTVVPEDAGMSVGGWERGGHRVGTVGTEKGGDDVTCKAAQGEAGAQGSSWRPKCGHGPEGTLKTELPNLLIHLIRGFENSPEASELLFLLIKKNPGAAFGLMTCGSPSARPGRQSRGKPGTLVSAQSRSAREPRCAAVMSGRMDVWQGLPGQTDLWLTRSGSGARALGQSLLEASGIKRSADRHRRRVVARRALQGGAVCLSSSCWPRACARARRPAAGGPPWCRAALSGEPGAGQGPLSPVTSGDGCPAQAGVGVGRGTVESGRSPGSSQVKHGDNCWEVDAT